MVEEFGLTASLIVPGSTLPQPEVSQWFFLACVLTPSASMSKCISYYTQKKSHACLLQDVAGESGGQSLGKALALSWKTLLPTPDHAPSEVRFAGFLSASLQVP